MPSFKINSHVDACLWGKENRDNIKWRERKREGWLRWGKCHLVFQGHSVQHWHKWLWPCQRPLCASMCVCICLYCSHSKQLKTMVNKLVRFEYVQEEKVYHNIKCTTVSSVQQCGLVNKPVHFEYVQEGGFTTTSFVWLLPLLSNAS